jgi:hypothetical protein
VVYEGNDTSRCDLVDSTEIDSSFGANETTGITQMTISNLATTTLSTAETIKLECGGSGTFAYAKLTATQVGAIH